MVNSKLRRSLSLSLYKLLIVDLETLANAQINVMKLIDVPGGHSKHSSFYH